MLEFFLFVEGVVLPERHQEPKGRRINRKADKTKRFDTTMQPNVGDMGLHCHLMLSALTAEKYPDKPMRMLRILCEVFSPLDGRIGIEDGAIGGKVWL